MSEQSTTLTAHGVDRFSLLMAVISAFFLGVGMFAVLDGSPWWVLVPAAVSLWLAVRTIGR